MLVKLRGLLGSSGAGFDVKIAGGMLSPLWTGLTEAPPMLLMETVASRFKYGIGAEGWLNA